MTTRKREQTQLGKNLSQFRDRAGLTQEKLAQRSGLSLETVCKIEQGSLPNTTLRTVFALTRAFEISVGELLKGVEVDFDEPDAKPRKRRRRFVKRKGL